MAEVSVMRELIAVGMNVARLNLSHGSIDEHRGYVEILRRLTAEEGVPVALLMDLPGPKYRSGPLMEGAVTLKKGDRLVLTTRPVPGSAVEVSVNLPTFPCDVSEGDLVLLDDGALQLRVVAVGDTDVITCVLVDGCLMPRRGIAVPGGRISSPFITDVFLAGADLAAELKPDFVAISMVSHAEDVKEARQHLRYRGCRAAIITKIERKQALDNFEPILEESDAVMVARGDLGVDVPLYEITLMQKDIIRRCNRAGKPVITATQMLESMISAARPTRAEVTDVANAIFDGTDAVMLSGETSVGKYPVEAVKFMAAVARHTEGVLPYRKLLQERGDWLARETDELIAYNACHTAELLGAKAIVAFTTSGSTVKRVAKFRPRMPVLAITPDDDIYGQLLLSWGVRPVKITKPHSVGELFSEAARLAEEMGLARSGDRIVITGGVPVGVTGTTNLLKVEVIS
ncbi:MAG: pyruvate kinase [Dehalococcoidia bacterium]|nr:pyruvate kinase [Dehalococcoidia bacterium]